MFFGYREIIFNINLPLLGQSKSETAHRKKKFEIECLYTQKTKKKTTQNASEQRCWTIKDFILIHSSTS